MPLEPMQSYDRRIIHMALREDTTVYTESTGEGENRRIVIFPRS
jgi:spoIIIJ-associated protein